MHKTITVRVVVDIDEGIADAVRYLNQIASVRTFASCQGTLNEGGPEPYRAHVMAYVPESAEELIMQRFEFGKRGDGWVYLHPKSGADWPDDGMAIPQSPK